MIKNNTINNITLDEHFAQGHRACSGCGCVLAVRFALKAAGKNTIVVSATGCMEVISSPYPETSWEVPWVHCAFETAGSVASGVYRALKQMKKDDKTKVLILAGDGGTFDIGFQALSGAAERGEDICYICYDNEAYMNTGIQRSGATPIYAHTLTTPAGLKKHGKAEFKKNLPLIMAAHGAYVATANIAYPQDFIAKVKKGLEFKGPAYIQVYSPCPVGWWSAANMTVEISRLAVQTKISPIYEIENGFLKFTRKVTSQKPIKDYLKTQGRFKHLTEEETKIVQDNVNKEYDKLLKFEESEVQF